MEARVGILGIGLHLPAQIRRNQWWPPEVVATWPRGGAGGGGGGGGPSRVLSANAARVMAAIEEQAGDPFQGVIERRVMAEGMTSTDMEVLAAEEALAQAGIARNQIDLVLTHTTVPEYLLSNSACVLHQRLELPAACFTLQVEAAAYSFMMQLAIAEQMIASGRAHYGLLVQSSATSRLLDPNDWGSPVFGDGASAVVVGRVESGGILAAAHRTDNRYPRMLVASVPGRRWYDEGKIIVHCGDRPGAREVFLDTADFGVEVITAALRDAGLAPRDVDFFGVHQGKPWLQKIAQDALGLDNARYVDLFAQTGYLFAASIPAVLHAGHRERLLNPGNLVVLFGGGGGATYGAIVMRWGDLAR
jgi:3-oxoacyl-[acyl-carrier-protein] synthase-3